MFANEIKECATLKLIYPKYIKVGNYTAIVVSFRYYSMQSIMTNKFISFYCLKGWGIRILRRVSS